METVGECIKHVRKQHDLTQKEFAEKIGIARSTLAGYETNQIAPSMNIVFTISSVFGISPSFFLRRMAIEIAPNQKIKGSAQIIDLVEELDKLLQKISGDENVVVGNKILKHESDASKLVYFQIKQCMNNITQIMKILEK